MTDWDKDFPAARPTPASSAPAFTGNVRRIRFRDDEPVEITLLHPLLIEEDEETHEITQLTIRRITSAEMIAVVESLDEEVSDAELIRYVTAAMAGVEIDVLAALSPDDAGRVATAALPFMPGGLVAAIERARIADEANAEKNVAA
ncbi:MAG: phage tail assembly protein [Rhabdaerophilum sp.]